MPAALTEREYVEKYLVNYTKECVDDILKNCPFNNRKRSEGRIIKKSQIMAYLKEKYGYKSVANGKGTPKYWIVRGFSKEEANKLYKQYSSCYNTFSVDAIMKRHNVSKEEAEKIFKERVNKARSTFENTHTEEEKKKINESKKQTLALLISRFGEEEGTKRWNQRLDKWRKAMDAKSDEEKAEMNNKKCNKLENLIARYGEEEGTRKWKETNAKKSFGHSLQGYIARHGEEEGTRKWKERQEKWQATLKAKPTEEQKRINKKKAITLENLVAKYGEEEGAKRWEKWHKGLIEHLKEITVKSSIGTASMESLQVFIPFYQKLIDEGIEDTDIYIGIPLLNKEEYILEDVHDHSFFMYDFTVLSKKLIVEFNGITFHPKSIDSNWKHPCCNISAKNAYQKDMLKKKLAEANGFHFLTLWSDETPENNLKILEEFYEKNCNNV